MPVRWSPEAAEDFARLVQHIRQESPSAAQRVAKIIYEKIGALEHFPNRGRPGRVEDTRELPLPPLPFVVIYRLVEQAVEIARILHGAQRWP